MNSTPFARNHLCALVSLLTILLLAGCGGGDKSSPSSLNGTATNISDDNDSAAISDAAADLEKPVLVLTPQPIKIFRFTWDDVDGATGYNLLEDPDGISGYSVIAAFGSGAISYDHEVFLPGRINARYVLQACDADGCVDSAPVLVSGTLASAVGYFKASNTGTSDAFGTSVALSADGNTMAVGAPSEASSATGINGNQADNSAEDSGAVYVFTRSDATFPWRKQAYVKASNTANQLDEDNSFGLSVSLSADGDTLVVGAPREDSDATGINGNQADNSAENSGAVYVFHRLESIWSQQAYIKASNTGKEDNFGWSIALSANGNTLAVGAIELSGSAIGNGEVYVFIRDGDIWSQQAHIEASNADTGDGFGRSVALSADGNTLAVGSDEDSSATGINGNQADNSAPASGAVYIFQRLETVWSQQAYIKASNTEAGDAFGSSVALSADGNTLAAGAVAEDSDATGINGNQADNSATPGSGAVYVFTRSGSAWSQQAYVKASNNTDAFDAEFGWSVALASDGNTLAVGRPYESSRATGINGNQADNSAENSGAVYVFTRNGTEWSQRAYVKSSNTDAGDIFGGNGYVNGSVALAGDGNTLAVGAVGEDSSARGINGNQADNSALASGAVYLY